LKIVGEVSKESREHNKLVGTSQVKGKIVEVSDDNNMDIDQSETSISKGLLTDAKLQKASKDELTNLIERAKNEIKRRENEVEENQGSNTSNYEVSTEELKNALSRAQSKLESVNTSISNNDTPNNSNVGGVLAVVSVVGVLAISGIAFVKNKLGKNK